MVQYYDCIWAYRVRYNTMIYRYSEIVMYNQCEWQFYKLLFIYRWRSRNDALRSRLTVVSGGVRSVYFHSKNDRHTEPWITEQYGRISPNIRSFTVTNDFRNPRPRIQQKLHSWPMFCRSLISLLLLLNYFLTNSVFSCEMILSQTPFPIICVKQQLQRIKFITK